MVILENLDQGRRILLFSNAIFPLLSHNWCKHFPLWEFIGDFDCIFLSVHYKTEYASLTTNIIQYNTNLIEKSPHVPQVTRAKTNRCSIKKRGQSTALPAKANKYNCHLDPKSGTKRSRKTLGEGRRGGASKESSRVFLKHLRECHCQNGKWSIQAKVCRAGKPRCNLGSIWVNMKITELPERNKKKTTLRVSFIQVEKIAAAAECIRVLLISPPRFITFREHFKRGVWLVSPFQDVLVSKRQYASLSHRQQRESISIWLRRLSVLNNTLLRR